MLVDVRQYEKKENGNVHCSFMVMGCMLLEFKLSSNEFNQPTFQDELHALDVELRNFFDDKYKDKLFQTTWLEKWKAELIRQLRWLQKNNTQKVVQNTNRKFYVMK